VRYILRTLKVAFLLFLVLTIGLGSYFLATFPAAYKTCTTIKFVAEPPRMVQQNENAFVDIRNVISKIPYQPHPAIVYVPKPELKYKQTIIDGRGNCSNMSFGLSYRLREEGHNFQIVHLLSPNVFLKGVGHTVLNMPYQLDGENRYGVVDIFNAGLPTSNREPITIDQLRTGKLIQPGVLLLNSGRIPQLSFYQCFLDDSALALIENSEIDDYFKFMDSIYFSLGNTKIEKYFFETISFALGKYPNLYVANSDYDRLFTGNNKYIRYMALGLTWSIRFLIFTGPILVLAGVWNRVRGYRSKGKAIVRSEKLETSKEKRKHKKAIKKQLIAAE
jgi:hypothetical protein